MCIPAKIVCTVAFPQSWFVYDLHRCLHVFDILICLVFSLLGLKTCIIFFYMWYKNMCIMCYMWICVFQRKSPTVRLCVCTAPPIGPKHRYSDSWSFSVHILTHVAVQATSFPNMCTVCLCPQGVFQPTKCWFFYKWYFLSLLTQALACLIRAQSNNFVYNLKNMRKCAVPLQTPLVQV